MIKQIYTIFDKKAAFYFSDFITLDNDDVAKRWFDSYLHGLISDNPNAPMVMYPSDFELRCVGTFDFQDCITALYDSPRPVVSASSFIVK